MISKYSDRVTVIVPLVAAVVAAGLVTYHYGFHDSVLASRLQKSFPSTKFTGTQCDKSFGLCEVDAGKNVFYSTDTGRFVFVGEIIDLKDKVNLTDQRLKQIAAMNAATAAITGDKVVQTADASGGAASAQAVPPPQAPTNVKVTLPVGNAIVHNPGAPIKVSVFSDYSCHFCRQLFSELVDHHDIEVTEYPIAILGPDSETKAKLVLCSDDKIAAGQAAFNGGDIKTKGDCSKQDEIVRENTQFAQSVHINGTPTIIRADGRANSGYLPVADLIAFAKGSA